MSQYAKYSDIFSSKSEQQLFIEFAAQFSKVLEIGCGTGNTAIAIAKRNIRVWAIDNSSEMLKIFKSKIGELKVKIHIEQQGAEFLSLSQQFPFAFMHLVFGHFTTVSLQNRILANIKNHLIPGGELLFDLANPQFVPRKLEKKLIRTVRTKDLEYRLYLTHKPVSSLVQTTYVVEEWRNDSLHNSVIVSSKIALLAKSDIEKLLKANGFQIISIFGDYKQKEFDESMDYLMIFHARNTSGGLINGV